MGDFAKGTKDAAFEMGAAPINLINGETLLDLLMQHEIGIKKKTVEYYELDESAFVVPPDIEDEEGETEDGETEEEAEEPVDV